MRRSLITAIGFVAFLGAVTTASAKAVEELLNQHDARQAARALREGYRA